MVEAPRKKNKFTGFLLAAIERDRVDGPWSSVLQSRGLAKILSLQSRLDERGNNKSQQMGVASDSISPRDFAEKNHEY